MLDNSNGTPGTDFSTDVALIVIFALGIATWVCYFLSISGADF